jgi:hypothetical protein
MPSTTTFGLEHTHDWFSAKSILSDRHKIPETELLEIVTRNCSTPSHTQAEILELAHNTEAAWQGCVEACIRDKIPVLDKYGCYSRIPEVVSQVQRNESQVA